jgi:NAD-dependent SIR2 family protein deacetylase
MQFRCMDCKRKSKLEELKKEIAFGRVVYCRSPSCGGILKPDITFFGEELPEPFFKAIKQDVSKCDLVLVIGILDNFFLSIDALCIKLTDAGLQIYVISK